MFNPRTIQTSELQEFPFKLPLSLMRLLDVYERHGYTVSLMETVADKETAYFLVGKDGKRTLLGAIRGLLYTGLNSRLGYYFTINKGKSHRYLEYFAIPVPKQCTAEDDCGAFLNTYKKVVVKPTDGAKGAGVTAGITTYERLDEALRRAATVSKKVIVQQHMEGEDYRLLFIGNKFTAAIRRTPAHVVGNGRDTVLQLAEARNSQPGAIAISEQNIKDVIGEALLASVPKAGEAVAISDKANTALGGVVTGFKGRINPDLIARLEDMTKLLGLGLCGVDVISEDLASRPEEGKTHTLELNANPGLWVIPGAGSDKSMNCPELLFNHLEAQK